MLYPFLASIIFAHGVILDKIILSRKKIGHRVYILFLFIFLLLFTTLAMPFLGDYDAIRALEPKNIFAFIFLILTALAANIFYYQGIEKERVQDVELFIMSQPLVTVLLAGIFFPSERNFSVFISAVIASLALMFAHLKKSHLVFDKYSIYLIWAVIFMSIEALLTKYLLEIYTPVSLYFYRVLFLTFVFIIIWRPWQMEIQKALINLKLVIYAGFLGGAYMILRFYGFRDLGLIYTTLILILGPILVYIFDAWFLKEKIRLKTIIAAIVIFLAIIYAQFNR